MHDLPIRSVTPDSAAEKYTIHAHLERCVLSYHRANRGRSEEKIPSRSRALNISDLDIYSGHVQMIIGESGGGKSSLIHAIAGVLPSSATCDFSMSVRRKKIFHTDNEAQKIEEVGKVADSDDGESSEYFNQSQWLGKKDSHRAVRARLFRYMPQDARASLSPIQRLGEQCVSVMKARFPHLSHADALNLVADELKILGLGTDLFSFFAQELSGGMAQRFCLALALAGTPGILLADEPTSGVPSEIRSVMAERLRAYARAGGAVLCTSHDMDFARAVADDLALLSQGVFLTRASMKEIALPQAKNIHPLLRAYMSNDDTGDVTVQKAQPSDLAPQKARPSMLQRGKPALLTFAHVYFSYELPHNRSSHSLITRGLMRTHSDTATGSELASISQLQDINFSVFPGEICGIFGPSGAGKTTIAHLSCGLLSPSYGSIDCPTWRKDHSYIHFVMQHPYASFDPHMRVEKSVREHRLCTQLTRRQWKILVDLTEEFFPAVKKEWLYAYPNNLSLGQLQRLSLLRAILPAFAQYFVFWEENNGEYEKTRKNDFFSSLSMCSSDIFSRHVVICDEVTSGLDPLTRHEILTRIREFADYGGAVVMMSHESATRSICDETFRCVQIARQEDQTSPPYVCTLKKESEKWGK